MGLFLGLIAVKKVLTHFSFVHEFLLLVPKGAATRD
jgi:hypothetical protein